MKKSLPDQGRGRALLAVVLVTFACYAPAFFYDFVNYDDPALILENPIIQEFSFTKAAHILKVSFDGQYGRFSPLVFVVRMLLHHWVGFNPFWFHALNIVFHLGTVIVVFFLVKEITRHHRISLMAALLFGIHPVQVETVVWVTTLSYGMSTFFYLLAVYLYCRALNFENQESRLTGLSFFVFVVAGFCFAGLAVTLPVVLILLTYFKKKSLPARWRVRLIPFALLAGCFFCLTIFTAGQAVVIDKAYLNIDQYPVSTRINLSVVGILHYLKQILLPYSFTIEYPQGYFLPLSHPWLTIFFVLFAAGLIVQRGRFLQWRYFGLGFFFFLITIAPFLKLYSGSTSVTNDRYVYLASVGVFLLLAEWVVAFWSEEKRFPLLVKTVLISGCCYLVVVTWVTGSNWRNGGRLWGQMINMYPGAYPAYLGRADYYLRQGKYREALEDCHRALRYNPSYPDALSLAGEIFMRLKQYGQSIEVYSKLLNVDPRHIPALNNRGAAYLLTGQNNLALIDFNRSIEFNPEQVDPYFNRGVLYSNEKHYHEALSDFATVLDKQPGHPLAARKIEEINKLLRSP